MKMVKSLLLGSVAGIAAITGAQAADLPLAEPVEYVRICDTWGNGYFYIPGTQTCLQISGLVRFDLRYEEPFDRANDALTFRGRAQLQFDARTQTELGTLRSYLRMRGNYINNANTATDGDDFYVHQAFVQFAGFTAGKTQSFFDAVYDGSFTGAYNSEVTSTALLGYTATFGSGWSASLSIEDRSNREVAGGGAVALLGAPIAYAGTMMPDVVANVRVAQGWGSFQLSGAIHQNRDNTEVGGLWVGADDEYGFAVQAAGAVNLPMGGQGTRLWASAAYADGAIGYLGTVASPWVGSGTTGGIARADSFVIADGAGGFGLETSSGWAITGGGTWVFNPVFRSNLTLGYADVESDVVSLVGGAPVGDFSQFIAAANVIYTPVQNLDLGLEVFYRNIVDDNFDTPVITNDDSWGVMGRVERKF
ncbi:polymerase [Agaricicola taiwanensis]|uniref:Porin n=1 Tax=Agaricicola taiwanensis TaxID=591372 RepID=A0A8J2YK75_9RHOB|nr:porin [Agaricicola taiwanensis]GGE48157.1 polymerase [Agaricicola taiwanensis]